MNKPLRTDYRMSFSKTKTLNPFSFSILRPVQSTSELCRLITLFDFYFFFKLNPGADISVYYILAY